MRYAKELAHCFKMLGDADCATYYATPRTTIRVTKVRKNPGRFVVQIGRPNHRERANLLKWRKEGTPLTQIDIVLQYRGKRQK